MKLYNTLSKQIEEFMPQNPPKVTVYACGPTVYNYAHIGNFRTYMMTDVLVRILRYFDYNPQYVMNITDVGHLVSDGDSGEDKMEKGAKREGKTAWEIAAFYTEVFLSDSRKLNLIEPDVRPRPTQLIPEQIAMVKTLLDKELAYRIADGVYFDTGKCKDYGILTGQSQDDLKAGARVEVNPQKRNPSDFALWKLSPKNQKRQMEWESPWGVGFPGWHIECSVMSQKYLGDTIDIHTGGVDLIPIHHVNEIAQSEGATGKHPYVKYWIHGQFIQVDGEKMSKSSGNFYSIKDIEAKGYDPLALRYLYLTAHYRAFLNFTWTSLDGAARSLAELRIQVSALKRSKAKRERMILSPEKMSQVDNFRSRFESAICNDMNLPQALSVVWETVKSNIPATDKLELINSFDRIFGFNFENTDEYSIDTVAESVTPDIQDLLSQRKQLRDAGKFADADLLREKLAKKGFRVEDTKSGARLVKIPK